MKTTLPLLLTTTLLLLNLSCGTTPPQEAEKANKASSAKTPVETPSKTIKDYIVEETRGEKGEYTYAERKVMAAQDFINNIRHLLKTNQRAKLAEHLSFPINHPYPVPPIRNAKEFLERFEEIFDQETIKELNNDNDWWWISRYDEVGFQGGRFILDKHSEGYTLHSSYNNSEKSKQVRDKANAKERKLLHPSILKNTNSALLAFRTIDKSWTGRIDILAGDNDDGWNLKVQLSLYKKGSPLRGRPDYIIQGVCKTLGSCRNKFHCFTGGGKSFQVEKLNCSAPDDIFNAFYIYNEEFPLDDMPFYGNEEETHEVEWVIWQELL